MPKERYPGDPHANCAGSVECSVCYPPLDEISALALEMYDADAMIAWGG